LGILPPKIAERITEVNDSANLLEVILDLGRLPAARFLKGEVVIGEIEITREEIDFVVSQLGEIDADNRGGLERTLHRIAAIRNRRGEIVGLTCRVGRAVYGTTDIIKDLIESAKSLLILGRPGVGKTTMLRESARILAESGSWQRASALSSLTPPTKSAVMGMCPIQRSGTPDVCRWLPHRCSTKS